MADGFDFSELDAFERDLLSAAASLENGRYAKGFLRKEGTKLKKENKKQAKSADIDKKTGNFLKGFKRGKTYKFAGDMAIRAYNSAPHAHLLDLGHRIVDKNGVELGFKEGAHFMEKAEDAFCEEYIEDCQSFIDDLLTNHGL
jgi:hypothetical protein